MQLKTILNRVQKFKSFVYTAVRWIEHLGEPALEVEIETAVEWGRAQADYSGVQAIGIDEIAWQRGHKYLTLVYQIDAHCKRLLWVGNKRKIKTLLGFFRWFGRERSAALKYVCSDMWKPYLKVIAKKAGQAVHVLDRFHIMMHFSKALDAVRAEESKALKAKGYERGCKRNCVTGYSERVTEGGNDGQFEGQTKRATG